MNKLLFTTHIEADSAVITEPLQSEDERSAIPVTFISEHSKHVPLKEITGWRRERGSEFTPSSSSSSSAPTIERCLTMNTPESCIEKMVERGGEEEEKWRVNVERVREDEFVILNRDGTDEISHTSFVALEVSLPDIRISVMVVSNVIRSISASCTPSRRWNINPAVAPLSTSSS